MYTYTNCHCINFFRLKSSLAKIATKQWDARQTRANVNVAETTSEPTNASSTQTEISVKTTITIDGGKTITLDVEPTDTIRNAKGKIQGNNGTRIGRKLLLCRGKNLKRL